MTLIIGDPQFKQLKVMDVPLMWLSDELETVYPVPCLCPKTCRFSGSELINSFTLVTMKV